MDAAKSFEDKIILLREYDSVPGDGEVPDPYYGGIDGFENVFDIVKRSCETLLDELEERVAR
jgi:protein-tyrosine phosphatase